MPKSKALKQLEAIERKARWLPEYEARVERAETALRERKFSWPNTEEHANQRLQASKAQLTRLKKELDQ